MPLLRNADAHSDADTWPITLSALGRKVGGIDRCASPGAGRPQPTSTSTGMGGRRSRRDPTPAPIPIPPATPAGQIPYRACEAGTSTCSNDATKRFPHQGHNTATSLSTPTLLRRQLLGPIRTGGPKAERADASESKWLPNRHQACTCQPVLPHVFSKRLTENSAVVIIRENRFPPITPIHQMINRAWIFDPEGAGALRRF